MDGLKKSGLLVVAVIFAAYAFFQLASLNTLSISIASEFPQLLNLIPHLSFIYLITDAVFLIPAGLLLDRLPLKYLMPTALSFLILGAIFLTIAHGNYGLYMARFISGIGHAFAFLTGFKIIRYCVSDRHQAIGISMVVSIAMLGGFIAQAPFEVLVRYLGWRHAMLIDVSFGAVFLLFSLMMLQFFPEHKLLNNKLQLKDFALQLLSAAKNIENFTLGAVIGLLSIPILLLASGIGNLYLIEVRHLSAYQASSISSLIFLGTIVGMPFFGWVSDKIGNALKVMLMAAGISLIISIFTFFFLDNDIYVQGFLFLGLAFFTASQSLGYVLINKYNARYKNTAMALANVIIMLVGSLCPILVNLLSKYNLAIIISSAIVVSIALLCLTKIQHPQAEA